MDGPPPLIQKRKDRMVNVRNGLTHIGTAPDLSRHVLVDALTVIQAMLTHLGIDPTTFHGTHAGHVTDLLDAKKSERSEERRVGKVCVSKCRSRWSPYH